MQFFFKFANLVFNFFYRSIEGLECFGAFGN